MAFSGCGKSLEKDLSGADPLLHCWWSSKNVVEWKNSDKALAGGD